MTRSRNRKSLRVAGWTFLLAATVAPWAPFQVAKAETVSGASAPRTRLVVHVDQEMDGRTILSGSPFQILVAIVNHSIELADEARVDAWREASLEDPSLPRPAPVVPTPEDLVDLGPDNLAWFDGLNVSIETADGTPVLSGVDWAKQVSFPRARSEERVTLGRDPRTVTLQVSPDLSRTLAPGQYRVRVESPSWGTDSWDFTVRRATGDETAVQAHTTAKWELAHASAARALPLANEAAATLGATEPETYYTRARVHHALGSWEQSLEDVDRFLDFMGDDPRACFLVEAARRLREELVRRLGKE